MIEVRDLEFRYGDGEFRLVVPELDVERGSKTACIGPSGSGQTTLLSLIAGILTPQRGRVVTNGVAVSELKDAERRGFRITNIGLVFQESELLEYLSVLDNILLPYRINPALRLDTAVRQRAASLAEQMGIGASCGALPPSSPRVNASALRCAGPCYRSRPCCSPMSPRETWIQPTRGACST